jgi:hypothetical protein
MYWINLFKLHDIQVDIIEYIAGTQKTLIYLLIKIYGIECVAVPEPHSLINRLLIDHNYKFTNSYNSRVKKEKYRTGVL